MASCPDDPIVNINLSTHNSFQLKNDFSKEVGILNDIMGEQESNEQQNESFSLNIKVY
jgi:hypothetical protein